jgi:hypothetical protein
MTLEVEKRKIFLPSASPVELVLIGGAFFDPRS